MQSIGRIIGACLIILLLGSILVGINTFRSQSLTEAHGSLATGAGVTSYGVPLTVDLFDAYIYNVTSVTSNETTDVPLVTAYASATKIITITGLAESKTRTLTVIYKISSLDSYLAADLGARLYPFLLVLGVIGIIVGAVVVSFKRESD